MRKDKSEDEVANGCLIPFIVLHIVVMDLDSECVCVVCEDMKKVRSTHQIGGGGSNNADHELLHQLLFVLSANYIEFAHANPLKHSVFPVFPPISIVKTSVCVDSTVKPLQTSPQSL